VLGSSSIAFSRNCSCFLQEARAACSLYRTIAGHLLRVSNAGVSACALSPGLCQRASGFVVVGKPEVLPGGHERISTGMSPQRLKSRAGYPILESFFDSRMGYPTFLLFLWVGSISQVSIQHNPGLLPGAQAAR
jgi:hypothetical protein